ncbi:MAG: cell division protein FtsZ, partial [Candidatus Thorarchaeota archaeon]
MHPLLEEVLKSSGGKREAPAKKAKKTPKSATTDEELAALLESVNARILVVGVGGAGNNAITRLMEV